MKMSQTLQVLYHGNCFDGVMSAALFSRFYRDRVEAGIQIVHRAMSHGQVDPYGDDHDATFSAEINAVVDFRFSPSHRLDWWCDHHQSTFLTQAHQRYFEQHPRATHRFDPAAPSCAGLMARWLHEQHGFEIAPFVEHVHWADVIDSAGFSSATQAVELAEPALQLMALLEAAPPESLIRIMLEGFAEGTIEGVHRHPDIQQALQPVLEEHHRTIDLFRRRMSVDRGVAYVDLTADGVKGFNKFIPYFLDPGVRYTVVLTRSSRRAKISVGSNPFERPEPLVNIAELCGRYGGGGHPVVGAVTLRPGEVERARQASLEIAEALRRPLPES
jgi:hypothetical protein